MTEVTRDMLLALIGDTESDRQGAEVQLEEAEAETRRLAQRVIELREEEKSFRAALARRFPEEVESINPQPSTEAETWSFMPRTEAVERAIAIINVERATVSPADIEAFLASKGRRDDRDAIGGATAHLNRTGRIHSLGRGKWVHGPAPQMTPGGTATTVPPGLFTPTSAGGDDHAAPPAPAEDHDSNPGRDTRDLHRETAVGTDW